MMQHIIESFANLINIGVNLPTFVLVPLIIVLSLIGVFICVKAVQGLIKLLFGKKGKEFVNNFNDFTMGTEERTKKLSETSVFDNFKK